MDLTYEVITVQTKKNCIVRSMTYGEELELRAAILATKNKLNEMFNKILYNCIKDKPENLSFEEFLRTTTLNDRICLTAGLYIATYGNEVNTSTICPTCGRQNENIVHITPNNTFITMYQGKNILDETISYEGDEKTFVLEVPTLHKESEMLKSTEFMDISPSANEMLLHIKEISDGKKKISPVDRPIDALSILKSSTVRVIKQIRKKIQENFNRYSMSVKYTVNCQNPGCNNSYIREVDFVTSFLNLVFEA